MRTFSNFRKWKSVKISGNFQAPENFWKFTEICGNFHPRFPQISINFRRFFKTFPKIYGKFLKMVKWVKMFCLNSWFETKHLWNSSPIFKIKKFRSNFGHVLNIFDLLVILRYFLYEIIPIPEPREDWELQCSPFMTN